MALVNEKSVKLQCGKIIRVRSSQHSDAKDLITYCKNIFTTSQYVVTTIEEFDTTIENQEKRTQEINSKPGSVTVIAKHDDTIIGHINFTGNPKIRNRHRGMFGIGIIDSWRGKGVGKVLINTVIEWAKQDDNPIEKIELIVMAENEPAIHLYKKLGFIEEGRIIDEIKMSKDKYVDGILMGLSLK